jgi:C4-type Zn-finger protein
MRTVTDSTSIQCPVCGWTGARTDLDFVGGEADCPVCDEALPT